MVAKTHVMCGTDEALVKTCNLLEIGDNSIVCKDGTLISQMDVCYSFDFVEAKNYSVQDVKYLIKPSKYSLKLFFIA